MGDIVGDLNVEGEQLLIWMNRAGAQSNLKVQCFCPKCLDTLL